MDTVYLVELARAVFRELVTLKNWVFALFILTTFSVLTVGKFWPVRYETSITLYADVTNIIAPLLKGRAEVTSIDRSKQAQELIYTRRILKKVAEETGLSHLDDDVGRQERVVNQLRSSVVIQSEGKNFFTVSYANSNQDQSFKVLNAVVDAFILDTSEKKRRESRSAFEFIDQQVISYKRQLVTAEEKLKVFKSSNLDGTEAAVARRIESLRLQIEELKLSIDETQAQVGSLRVQLKDEGKYQSAKTELDTHMDRYRLLTKQIDELRLSYQESYPDIVELRDQIAALDLVIEATRERGNISNYSSTGGIENPLYEELRKKLSSTELDFRSQKKRLESIKSMLGREYQRAERVAAREAELSELQRDNNVTRNIYEEMLERKEKARLSMTLDIEGQGVSYKIQEPAVYPLKPSGLRFIHFVTAAPLMGLVVALGLIVAYVILDPRVRSPSQLVQNLPPGIELLAVVPHVNSAITSRLFKADIAILTALFVVAVAAYVGVAGAILKGLI